MSREKTALSYWFPLIEAAGISVPKTTIIKMPKDAQESIWNWFDGKEGNGAEKPFLEALKAAASEIGFPVFLRTDHTSGKHAWERCCFLKSASDVTQHVFNLAEHSEIIDFPGLPWDTWVVREFLPTIPLGICPRYGNMPVCREFRFFVDESAVRCWHPYWPKHALEEGGFNIEDGTLEALGSAGDSLASLHGLAERVGRAVDGAWSVDILETKRGWYVTDMAEAANSWHEWPDCQNTFRK